MFCMCCSGNREFPVHSQFVGFRSPLNTLICKCDSYLSITPCDFPCCVVGVGTKIDPTLCRADRMVGQVLGAVGALPEIFTELEISYFLLRRLLGVRTEGDKKAAKVCSPFLFVQVFFHNFSCAKF